MPKPIVVVQLLREYFKVSATSFFVMQLRAVMVVITDWEIRCSGDSKSLLSRLDEQ